MDAEKLPALIILRVIWRLAFEESARHRGRKVRLDNGDGDGEDEEENDVCAFPQLRLFVKFTPDREFFDVKINQLVPTLQFCGSVSRYILIE